MFNLKNFAFILMSLFFTLNCFAHNVKPENVRINELMKKKILASSLKAPLRTSGGNKFIAYVYAEDEKTHPADEFLSCWTGKSTTYEATTGHYSIYLYNVRKQNFLPYRINIFNNYKHHRFHVEGADVMVISSTNSKRSDILLISQFGTCRGNSFEAYGFSKDDRSLEPYGFFYQDEPFDFHGIAFKSDDDPEVTGYGTYGTMDTMQNVTLTVSDIRGRVRVAFSESGK